MQEVVTSACGKLRWPLFISVQRNWQDKCEAGKVRAELAETIPEGAFEKKCSGRLQRLGGDIKFF
jgi:hypothetical protein